MNRVTAVPYRVLHGAVERPEMLVKSYAFVVEINTAPNQVEAMPGPCFFVRFLKSALESRSGHATPGCAFLNAKERDASLAFSVFSSLLLFPFSSFFLGFFSFFGGLALEALELFFTPAA